MMILVIFTLKGLFTVVAGILGDFLVTILVSSKSGASCELCSAADITTLVLHLCFRHLTTLSLILSITFF